MLRGLKYLSKWKIKRHKKRWKEKRKSGDKIKRDRIETAGKTI